MGTVVRSRPAVLLLLLGLLAGCRLDLAVDVAIDRDGSGRMELTLAADAALLSRAEAAGADPLTALADSPQLREAGWRVVEREARGGGRSVTLTRRFASSVAFNELAADLAEGLAAPELSALGPLTLEVTEDRIVLDGWAGLEPTPAVAEIGLTPEDAVRTAADLDVVGYQVRVSLPGAVLDTTAASVDGRVLTWDVAPGERVHLFAVGERPGPALWPLAAATLAAAALAGLVLARVAQRRRRTLGPSMVVERFRADG